MALRSAKVRSAAWHAAAIAIPIVAIFVFLRDLATPNWSAWVLPPLLVVAFYGAVSSIRRDALARSVLWLAALLALAFVSIYDILDTILDPIIASDRLIGMIAALAVLGLWSLLGTLISLDDG